MGGSLYRFIMDFHQTTERYKKREFRNNFSLGAWLVVVMATLWMGWFWGNSQQGAELSFNTQQLTDLQQQNERLQQELATLNNDLIREQTSRISAELELEKGSQSDEIKRLKRIVARHLAGGVSEDQIRLALQSVSNPSRCRLLEEKDLAVATSFFAGGESNTSLLDGAVRVFVEGEAGKQATKDRPWFDAEEQVSMRVAYLNGEKITKGYLPISMNIIADTWLLKINVTATALNGYVRVAVSKCNIN